MLIYFGTTRHLISNSQRLSTLSSRPSLCREIAMIIARFRIPLRILCKASLNSSILTQGSDNNRLHRSTVNCSPAFAARAYSFEKDVSEACLISMPILIHFYVSVIPSHSSRSSVPKSNLYSPRKPFLSAHHKMSVLSITLGNTRWTLHPRIRGLHH